MNIRKYINKIISETIKEEEDNSIVIFNTAILTDFGSYDYSEISLNEAKDLVKDGFRSALGHQATCDIISKLLDIDVKMNRINYKQKDGETVLVFKLKGRPEEGKILTVDEIEEVGYTFGLLKKLK